MANRLESHIERTYKRNENDARYIIYIYIGTTTQVSLRITSFILALNGILLYVETPKRFRVRLFRILPVTLPSPQNPVVTFLPIVYYLHIDNITLY